MALLGINYSPLAKMDISSLNERDLQALKYHQLLKLSNKYNVKKRWAKKDDLIKCLLNVKQKLKGSSEVQDNSLNAEIEWTDAQELFKDAQPLPEEVKNLQRSTFTVTKDSVKDSRATYSLVIPKEPPKTVINTNFLDSRLTFDIPKSKPKNLMTNKDKPKIKMLTVPINSGRIPSRTVTTKTSSTKESPLKLSNRSIAIKKAKDTMSPLKAARSLLTDNKQAALRSSIQRLSTLQESSVRKSQMQNSPAIKTLVKRHSPPQAEKENKLSQPRTSSRRKSKSDNPTSRSKSKFEPASAAAAFRTPPLKSGKKQNANAVEQKPITATKMPDFAAIHRRQFQKMDSLDEYINKKADRVKKLFGTPTTFRPFEKVDQEKKHLHKITEQGTKTVKPRMQLSNALDGARKYMSRNPPMRTQTEVKDKNRSHIHGIRSNRRFELQMKFRQL